MNSGGTLSELLRRISLGDENAFEDFYYQTCQSVYAYLLSLTKDPEDAKDLLQETYIKIRGASHLYKDQNTPMAWILRICRNEFLMKARKDAVRKTVPMEEAGEIQQKFDGIESVENRMVLTELFTAVSEEERDIILMHVVMGMKNREIADYLDMPVGTVLSKYNRGIKKLKEAMERKEDI